MINMFKMAMMATISMTMVTMFVLYMGMTIMCDQCGKSSDPVDNPTGPGPLCLSSIYTLINILVILFQIFVINFERCLAV